MSSLKALLTTGLVVGMNMPLMLPAAHAQITVTLEGVTATAPAKGETQSLNVSQGARTTLAVGNGVQLGTSAQMSSSIGTTSISRSVLEPTSIALGSSIGMNDTQTTTINIENITANGNGGNINSQGGSNITVAEGSKFASGRADIVGMTAESKILVDTAGNMTYSDGKDGAPVKGTAIETGGKQAEASYFASVNPEVMKDNDPYYRDLLVDADGVPIRDSDGKLQYTGAILTKDSQGNIKTDESGAPVAKGATGGDTDYWDTVNACAPDSGKACMYEDADILKTGNANASSNYQTTTNIDINSSNFTNVFGQAF